MRKKGREGKGPKQEGKRTIRRPFLSRTVARGWARIFLRPARIALARETGAAATLGAGISSTAAAAAAEGFLAAGNGFGDAAAATAAAALPEEAAAGASVRALLFELPAAVEVVASWGLLADCCCLETSGT